MNNYVDKVRSVPYRLGDIYSSKKNVFYIIVALDYSGTSYYGSIKPNGGPSRCYITLVRLGKNLKSQGNRSSYYEGEFLKKFKPLTEGQKLLFLHEEIKNEQLHDN